MGDPWGIGGFRGEENPNIKYSANCKKKIGQKFLKNQRNWKNLIFFFTGNGLKCIKNPTKHL